MKQFNKAPDQNKKENRKIVELFHSLGHHISTFLLIARDEDDGFYNVRHIEYAKNFTHELLLNSKNEKLRSILKNIKKKLMSIDVTLKPDNVLLDEINELLDQLTNESKF